MRDGSGFRAWNNNEMFLRVTRRLVDRERGINALPETDANTAFLVSDDNHQTEIESPSSRHNARHAPRVNRRLFKLAAFA